MAPTALRSGVPAAPCVVPRAVDAGSKLRQPLGRPQAGASVRRQCGGRAALEQRGRAAVARRQGSDIAAASEDPIDILRTTTSPEV